MLILKKGQFGLYIKAISIIVAISFFVSSTAYGKEGRKEIDKTISRAINGVMERREFIKCSAAGVGVDAVAVRQQLVFNSSVNNSQENLLKGARVYFDELVSYLKNRAGDEGKIDSFNYCTQ